MKKVLILLVIAICSICAYAGSYDYVTFITSDGTQQIASSGLTMTISGSNLIADNGTTSLTLSLASLQKMYFSDENGIYSGLNQTAFDNNAEVIVSSLEGKTIGRFENMRTAVSFLTSGTYIVTQNTNSIKILVP